MEGEENIVPISHILIISVCLKEREMKVIDLFCGTGGFSKGIIQSLRENGDNFREPGLDPLL